MEYILIERSGKPIDRFGVIDLTRPADDDDDGVDDDDSVASRHWVRLCVELESWPFGRVLLGAVKLPPLDSLLGGIHFNTINLSEDETDEHDRQELGRKMSAELFQQA